MSALGIIATIREPRINTNEHEFLTTKHTKHIQDSVIFVFQETTTASAMSIADSYNRNGWIDGRSRFR